MMDYQQAQIGSSLGNEDTGSTIGLHQIIESTGVTTTTNAGIQGNAKVHIGGSSKASKLQVKLGGISSPDHGG
jgi:hypothetical protein